MPTQTVSGSEGSTRIAPMDWAWSSKTGSKVVPAFSDFQTPPLADPTHTVTGSSATPSMAEIRPLMTAGPMARARSPPKVAESMAMLGASAANAAAASASAAAGAAYVGYLMIGPPLGLSGSRREPARSLAAEGAADRPYSGAASLAAAFSGIAKRSSGISTPNSTSVRVMTWAAGPPP